MHASYIGRNQTLILNEIDNILASPRTELIATWSDPDPDASPRLWHRNPVRGTVVTAQFQHPRHVEDVRCITYLTTTMPLHADRERMHGLMLRP